MITIDLLEDKILRLREEEDRLLAQVNSVVGAMNMCRELIQFLGAQDDTIRVEDRVY